MQNILTSHTITRMLQLQDLVSTSIWMQRLLIWSPMKQRRQVFFFTQSSIQVVKQQQGNNDKYSYLKRQRLWGSLEVPHLKILKLLWAMTARPSILGLENVLRLNSNIQEKFFILLFSTAFGSALWDVFHFPWEPLVLLKILGKFALWRSFKAYFLVI